MRSVPCIRTEEPAAAEARAAAEKAHLPEEENLGDAMESAVERAIAEAKISEPIFQEPVFVEKQEETDEEE